MGTSHAAGSVTTPRRIAAAVAAAALLALWLWLLAGLPLRHDGFSPYDAALFLRQAQHLVRGDWLGPYDALTLAKGAGFPLWLAAVHQLGLSALTAAALTHAAACALAARALRPLLPAPGARLAVFAALLFMPTALGEWSTQRELVYPAAHLLLVTSALGWLLRLTEPRRNRWALLAGAAAAWVMLTREDIAMLAPLAVAVFGVAITGGRCVWRPIAASLGLLLPLALLPLLVVAALNQRAYGVFTLVEMDSRPFTSAYGALARIRDKAAPPPQVPVSRASWQRAAAMSPAFALTEKHLSGEVGKGGLGPGIGLVGPLIASNDAVRLWLSQQIGYAIPPGSGTEWFRRSWTDDAHFHERFARYVGSPAIGEAFLSGAMDEQIAAWRLVWYLRDSAAAAGQFSGAAQAARHWQQVAEEIDAACAAGKLDCRDARHTLRPPLTREHWRWWPWAFGVAAQALVSFESLATAAPMGYLGTAEQQQAAAAFLRERLAPPHTTLAPVPAMDALIAAWRHTLPWLSAAALLAWLACTPWPWSRAPARQRLLWATGALLLSLVALRLAALALIHVSSWPAATLPRYLAPAHAPLVLFIAMAAALVWLRLASASASRRAGEAPLR